MASLISHRSSVLCLSAIAAGVLCGVRSAQAQAALSLTPLVSTAAVGSTVTFTVNLTGGVNLAAYNINVLANPALLQFVGPPLFTGSAPAAFFTLPPQVSASGGDLNFSGGNFTYPGYTNTGILALGTFQVKVLSALPATGTVLTFGPTGTAGGFGGTSVMDSAGTNQLTATTGATLLAPVPAPEPSQTAALGLGALSLAVLALRARKRAPAA